MCVFKWLSSGRVYRRIHPPAVFKVSNSVCLRLFLLAVYASSARRVILGAEAVYASGISRISLSNIAKIPFLYPACQVFRKLFSHPLPFFSLPFIAAETPLEIHVPTHRFQCFQFSAIIFAYCLPVEIIISKFYYYI